MFITRLGLEEGTGKLSDVQEEKRYIILEECFTVQQNTT
jgi:hypothetical protein